MHETRPPSGQGLNAIALMVAADLAGTVLFGLEGAFAAIRGGLDLVGVLVLAMVTAVGGGVLRDVLIGAAPPGALADRRYLPLAAGAGLLAFVQHAALRTVPGPLVLALDAGGLALFAVAGTAKALEFGIRPLLAPLLGTLTAVGGGVMRDVLLAQVPVVLRADFYATAAFAGSALMTGALAAGVPLRLSALAGGLVCLVLRLLALAFGWHLPVLVPA